MTRYARFSAFFPPFGFIRLRLALIALAGAIAVLLPPSSARAQATVSGTPSNAVYISGGAAPVYFYDAANAARLAAIINGLKAAADQCNDVQFENLIEKYYKLWFTLYGNYQNLYNTYLTLQAEVNNA
jgi:hypothetical protein